MAELKTQRSTASVTKFLAALEDPQRRKECKTVAKMMRDATGARARMWGESIVGFGSYSFSYASGRSGEWFLAGYSPRKGNLTLYIMSGFSKAPALLKKLGPHKTGKACLYIKHLADIDLDVLRQLIEQSVAIKRGGTSP